MENEDVCTWIFKAAVDTGIPMEIPMGIGMGIPWEFPRVFRGYGMVMGIEIQSARQSCEFPPKRWSGRGLGTDTQIISTRLWPRPHFSMLEPPLHDAPVQCTSRIRLRSCCRCARRWFSPPAEWRIRRTNVPPVPDAADRRCGSPLGSRRCCPTVQRTNRLRPKFISFFSFISRSILFTFFPHIFMSCDVLRLCVLNSDYTESYVTWFSSSGCYTLTAYWLLCLQLMSNTLVTYLQDTPTCNLTWTRSYIGSWKVKHLSVSLSFCVIVIYSFIIHYVT